MPSTVTARREDRLFSRHAGYSWGTRGTDLSPIHQPVMTHAAASRQQRGRRVRLSVHANKAQAVRAGTGKRAVTIPATNSKTLVSQNRSG